ncbi:MAG: histidine kinase [Flavobacteriales bacterium]|nr:histidine kinase [Flavobacteriales bacterium]
MKNNRALALYTAGSAIEWSIQHHDVVRIAESYLNRAHLLSSYTQHQAAIQDYKRVISTCHQRGLNRADLLQAAYSGLIQSLIELQQIDSALQYCAEGLLEPELLSVRDAQHELLRLKSTCLKENGQYAQAATILEELLEVESVSAAKGQKAKTMILLGEIYQQMGEFSKAENYLQQARELASAAGAQELVIQSNDALASVYRQTFNTDMELMTRNSNIALNQQSNDVSGVVIQNFEIGNAFIQKGDLSRAEDFIAKAKELSPVNSKEAGFIDHEYSSADLRQGALALKNLASEFQKKNELEKALKYYRDYAEMLDSAQSLQQKELENAIALSSDLGRNQQRIDWLEKENELSLRNMNLLRDENALKESQVSRRNIIIISLGILLLFAFLFSWILYRNTKARRRSEQIIALQNMVGQMNPHFIFNALNSVNEYVAKNDEREANRFITSFSKLMRRVLDDSGRTFISLADEWDMLSVYLQLENSRFPDKFRYDWDIDPNLLSGEIYLPPMMIQPLAENAIWHGLRYRENSGLLVIRMRVVDEKLFVILEDNGVGIHQSSMLKTQNQQQQKSHAIANMKKRIDVLNELYHCEISLTTENLTDDSAYPGTKVTLNMKLMTIDFSK